MKKWLARLLRRMAEKLWIEAKEDLPYVPSTPGNHNCVVLLDGKEHCFRGLGEAKAFWMANRESELIAGGRYRGFYRP